jgi:hypothetical protein
MSITLAVSGNAIVSDSNPANAVNIANTADGAIVTPTSPGQTTGVFHCSIQNLPGSVKPLSVLIQTANKNFTDVAAVTVFSGNSEVGTTTGSGFSTTSPIPLASSNGDPSLGWGVTVTLTFGGAASTITIASLGLQF